MLAEAAAHAEECVFLQPRHCPLLCGATILGREYKSHIEHFCPERWALCPDGCGQEVRGKELPSHTAVCPMLLLLDKADVALRESAYKELKGVMAQIFRERIVANGRMEARKAALSAKGWPTKRCEIRVAKVEEEMRYLAERCRRRSRARMIAAVASRSSDKDGDEQELVEEEDRFREEENDATFARSTTQLWDSLSSSAERSANTISSVHMERLQELLDALEEGTVCASDQGLRRRCEAAVANLVEAAIEIGDKAGLVEVANRAGQAMREIDLFDRDTLPALLGRIAMMLHHTALQEVVESDPHFFDAVGSGDVDVCSWYFQRHRANPSTPHPRTGLTPLVIAAKSGDLDMCSMLIANRAEVNGRCKADGFTALHWASHLRYARIAEALLASRANPKTKDRHGQDALMKLVRRDLEAAAPGYSWGWEVQPGRRLPGNEIKECSGVMSVEEAKVTGELEPACVGFTFRSAGIGDEPQHPVHISVRSARELTPQVRMRTFEVGLSLLETKEETKEEDESLWTTYLRVHNDPAHDIRMLLGAAADPAAEDDNGMTALHHHLLSAPGRGSMPAVAALLHAQADVNHRDRTRRSTTPLLLAVAARRVDLVEIMLMKAWPPADPDTTASDGSTALELAETKGAREVAALLRSVGASTWREAEAHLGHSTTVFVDTRLPVLSEA